jgi:hypothetical protein
MGVIVQSHVLAGISFVWKTAKDLAFGLRVSDILGDELEVKNRGRQIPLECQGSDTECHSDLC